MKLEWYCLFLVLLGLAVFLNAYPGAFHFDDWPLLLENPDVTGSNFRYSFFLTHYGGRPLTLLSFRWNYLLFGANPAGFFLVNLLLHLSAAVAVFLLIARISRNPGLAFFSGAVFAVHPLQTQPVNYVWSRSVLLMADFGLLALLLIRKRPWIALLSFQLAIWARTEALAILPLLLILAPSRWKPFSLLAGINGASFLLGLLLTGPAEIAWKHPDVIGYWSGQSLMFWKYIGLMVWPSGLSIDHAFGPYGPWMELAGFLGLAAVLMVLARFTRWGLPWSFAGFWLIAPLVPSLLIPNSDPFNESRLYLSVGGAAFLAGLALFALFRGQPGSIRLSGVLLVLVLSIVTIGRNEIWKSDVAIWEDAVSKNPSKARVHYNLGSALAREGLLDRAETAFQNARRLNPRDDMSYAALGYCAEVRGDRSAARRLFERALDLNPGNEYARQGYSRISAQSGRGDGPARTVQTAETVSPAPE